MGQKLVYVPECHSTNTLLLELNDQNELPEGTVVITDRQTAGRGQRGNVWITEPGMNLTCSTLAHPRFLDAKDQFRLNMAVSLAVKEALEVFCKDAVKLKWPNDIMVNDMKLVGILIENTIHGNSLHYSIIGIGINVNQKIFSHPHATSLHNLTGFHFDLDKVFQQLMTSLEQEYLQLRSGSTSALKPRYLEALYRFNESNAFETNGENFMGSIRDVDDNGKLCVEIGGQVRKFSFKEVSYLN